MSWELFQRLTPKGKRRAVIIDAISCILWIAIMFVIGYALCALVAGVEMLADVF